MEFANENHQEAFDHVRTYLTELFEDDLYRLLQLWITTFDKLGRQLLNLNIRRYTNILDDKSILCPDRQIWCRYLSPVQ